MSSIPTGSVQADVFPGAVVAGLVTTGPAPYALVELSQHPARVTVKVTTIAEADACIAGFTAAKALLTGAGVTS